MSWLGKSSVLLSLFFPKNFSALWDGPHGVCVYDIENFDRFPLWWFPTWRKLISDDLEGIYSRIKDTQRPLVERPRLRFYNASSGEICVLGPSQTHSCTPASYAYYYPTVGSKSQKMFLFWIEKIWMLRHNTCCNLWVKAGLYMIGYGTGKNILKFPPFCQLNQEYQEQENSK